MPDSSASFWIARSRTLEKSRRVLILPTAFFESSSNFSDILTPPIRQVTNSFPRLPCGQLDNWGGFINGIDFKCSANFFFLPDYCHGFTQTRFFFFLLFLRAVDFLKRYRAFKVLVHS